MNPLKPLIVAIALIGFAAPGAHADTRIGVESGAGPNAGSATRVTGDRRANDITITLSRSRARGGAQRFTMKIHDRRGRVRGCPRVDRHTVLCASSPRPLVYAFLGAGADRLTVKVTRGGAPVRFGPPVLAAPDGLAGIPSDEDGEGAFLGWKIDGGPGDDRISGSPYFDHIIGGPGSDVLDGRRGEDLFEEGGETGTDTIRGGSGRDTLQWRAATPLNVDLSHRTFTAGTVDSIEKVQGGEAADTLIGSDGPDMLQGGAGADVVAGRGGADLLVGDGEYTFLLGAGADTVDGGSGDDVLDIDNKAFSPYGATVVGGAPGPPDRLTCGDGNDRVDASASQLVPADCEGSRFLDAAATVALRPTPGPGGSLAYDVPCPAHGFFARPISVCDGTLTVTRAQSGAPLGASAFSAAGGGRALVVVTPTTPIAAGDVLGVQIKGSFNRARPDDTFNRFDFGWATAF